MEKNAKVVIIGGGVVGCSILYHLSKFGLKDCILLERNELTSGSSWHAAGNVHVISSDPNISRMMAYTIGLYKEIEKEISELTEDGSPYWNKTHPNHKKTVDQVFKLREQLNG